MLPNTRFLLVAASILTACGTTTNAGAPVNISGISESQARQVLEVAVTEASKFFDISVARVVDAGFSVEVVSETEAAAACLRPALGCFVIPERRILISGMTDCDRMLVLGHEYLHLIAATVGASHAHIPPLFRSWDRSDADWDSAESQTNLELVESVCSSLDSITLLGYSIVYGTLLELRSRGL